MNDEADKIHSWFPGTGEVVPLRYSGWWVQYPKPSCSGIVAEPTENARPFFSVGDFVRLKGKPDRLRRVLSIEWHCHRYEFVYIIETSVRSTFGYYDSPYWFEPQLVLENRVS